METDKKEKCVICGRTTHIEKEEGNHGVIKCYCPLCKKEWFENGN